MSEEASEKVIEDEFLEEMAGDEPTIEAENIEPELGEPEEDHKPAYTDEQVTNAFDTIKKLQTSIDTLNGTYGNKIDNLQQTIAELEGKVQPGTLPESVMAKLKEDYPELAEAFTIDEEPENKEEKEPERSAADIRLDEYIAQQNEDRQQRELKALTAKHSDWQDIAMFTRDNNGLVIWNDPNFGQFVQKLPENERNDIFNVWDAQFISDKITQYKETLKKPKQKQSLENAVRPQGSNHHESLSEEDEIEAAFKKEMAIP